MSKQYKLLVIILTGLFILVGILVKNDLLESFDTYINTLMLSLQSERWTFFFRQMTRFGNGEIVLTICIAIFLISKRLGYLSFLNIIVITILNNLLKISFSRLRPDVMQLVETSGYSFPSGHAMISMAFYGLLIYFVIHSSIQKNLKYLLCGIFATIILFVGISRVYLGVHYASDVIGGYLVSIIFLLLFLHVLNKR